MFLHARDSEPIVAWLSESLMLPAAAQLPGIPWQLCKQLIIDHKKLMINCLIMCMHLVSGSEAMEGTGQDAHYLYNLVGHATLCIDMC